MGFAKLCLSMALATVAAASLAAQPFIKSRTDVVRVTMVVTDHKGTFVPGLTQDDFTITENGKPVTAAFFREVNDAAASPAAGRRIAPTTASSGFSNIANATVVPNVTIILLDRINAGWESQARARNALEVYLAQIHPRDRIALFALDGDALRVVHDFTTDASSLLLAVSGAARPDAASVDPGSAGLGDEYIRHMASSAASTTMVALETLAQHFQSVPGRKNLVWISSGFDISDPTKLPGFNATSAIDRATHALNSAQISVYSIDPRGLTGPFAKVTATPTTFGSVGSSTLNHDILQILSEETGGRVFLNNNDIAGSVRTAIDDAEHHYEIGYYSPVPDSDGRYRQIRMTAPKSGLDLRYRRGYYATPAAAPGGDRKTALERAIGNPLDATGIPVTVTSTAVGSSGSGIELSVHVDGDVVGLARDNGTWTGSLDVAIAQVRGDGTTSVDVDTTLAIKVNDEQHDALLQRGLSFTKSVPIGPQTSRVVVVVRDAASGTLGSVVIPATKLQAPR